MIVDATYSDRALLLLGASRVAEIRDDAGNLTGYDVHPDIDLEGYEDAKQAVLEFLKNDMKLQIDQMAETERLKYITGGAGQAMTYQQKTAEARAILDDVDPDPAAYPLIAAEIGITGPTLPDVATIVLSAFQQWQLIGAQIEATRLGAKAAIDLAETEEDARQVLAAVIWPGLVE